MIDFNINFVKALAVVPSTKTTTKTREKTVVGKTLYAHQIEKQQFFSQHVE